MLFHMKMHDICCRAPRFAKTCTATNGNCLVPQSGFDVLTRRQFLSCQTQHFSCVAQELLEHSHLPQLPTNTGGEKSSKLDRLHCTEVIVGLFQRLLRAFSDAGPVPRDAPGKRFRAVALCFCASLLWEDQRQPSENCCWDLDAQRGMIQIQCVLLCKSLAQAACLCGPVLGSVQHLDFHLLQGFVRFRCACCNAKIHNVR